MAGMRPERQLNGTWVYPCIGAALAMVGLEEIWVYIACCQNMVAQYISTRTIMDLCLEAERRTGMRFMRRWWEQTNLDILGIRAAHAAEDMAEEMGTEEL